MLLRFRPARLAAFLPVLAATGIGAGCAQLAGLEERTAAEDDASPDVSALTPDAGKEADNEADVDANAVDATSPPDTSTPIEAGTMDAPPGPDADAMPVACADPCDMADGLDEPFVMTSNSQNVFWVDFGDTVGAGNGALKACSVNGCNGTPAVWQSGLMDPRGITVDASNVYWGTTFGGVVGTMGAIWSCPVATGAAGCQTPKKLADALDPYGLAADGTYVYWVDANLNTVHRVRANGTGTDQVLYTPPGAASSLGVFIDSPIRCAVDNINLYLLDLQADVYKMPKAGGTPTLVTTGNNIVSDITVDGTGYVYFGQQNNLRRTNATTPITLAANSSSLLINLPDGLALDTLAGNLYWADYGSGVKNDGTIGRVATSGTQPVLLQQSLATPSSVTVSGNYVFWLSAGDLSASTSTTTSYVTTNTGRLWRTHK